MTTSPVSRYDCARREFEAALRLLGLRGRRIDVDGGTFSLAVEQGLMLEARS